VVAADSAVAAYAAYGAATFPGLGASYAAQQSFAGVSLRTEAVFRQLKRSPPLTWVFLMGRRQRSALGNMPIGIEVARRTPPYGLHMVPHGYAWRPFTPLP
jgi:hypothetical protein